MLILSVCECVLFECAFPSESFVAEMAEKRFLTGVCGRVLFEDGCAYEFFVTDSAGMCSFIVVVFLVSIEGG